MSRQDPFRSPLRPAPEQTVVVRTWLDSSVHWYEKDRPLTVRELQIPQGRRSRLPSLHDEGDVSKESRIGYF
jgi:hypothetical protein